MGANAIIPWNVMLKDITKEWIINHSVNVEAGYVNNKNDLGKETNCGITYATAQEWKTDLVRHFGWDGRMINLTREMAWYIYDKGWWQRMRCDELMKIHPLLCQRLFDFAINGGRVVSVKYLQRLLNVLNRQGKDYADITPDGGVGPATIGALRAYVDKRGKDGIATLIQFQFALQGNHYVTLAERSPTQEDFVNGWGARIRDVNNLYFRTKK